MRLSRIAITTINHVRWSSSFAFEKLVNEENISRTLANLRTRKPLRLGSQTPTSKAAVLIPICFYYGKISLLYTLRTSHLSSHKGQVSFPGGRHDFDDGTLENTAIRETREELGLDPKFIKIWGIGNCLQIYNMQITPVIGHITSLSLNELNINHHEVEEVFCLSLESLCDPTKQSYTQFNNSHSTPVFLGGRRRIWGITACITHIFLNCFVSSDVYHHKIKFLKQYEVSRKKQGEK